MRAARKSGWVSDHKHGDTRSIFPCDPNLGVSKLLAGKRDLLFRPEIDFIACGRIEVGLNWCCEGLFLDEHFRTVPRASGEADSVIRSAWQLTQIFAAVIEDVHHYRRTSDACNKNSILSDETPLNLRFFFGNDVHELRFHPSLSAQLNDSEAGGLAICDRQNSAVVQQVRTEFVVRIPDQGFGRVFLFWIPQIEVRASWTQESVHEETKMLFSRDYVQTNILPFTGRKYLAVVIEAGAQDMVIGRTIVRPRRINRLMHVVETLAVRREREASQVATRERVRQSSAALNVQQIKCSGPFSALFDFVQQQTPIRRREEQIHCGVVSGAILGRINEKLIASVPAFAKIDARLFLGRKSFAEKVTIAGLVN